ncbi:agamous-like MADS-box protein AGL80 [Impatiens glandulifera]|uniref:agamous-like MADS-box protein AGL80 n=1 Tax=Impatiens glandulifera TaxID=253017 RepID=UPI001FB05E51|nr:agamous-like MADS-box protein AGL80 [Impatiens glandulifera]
MTRSKVKLSYILNDTKRKNTFKKRQVGVVKKLDELTTLCGIEACTIIYNSFDPQPLVWPSVDEARRLIMKLKSFSKVDQVKRQVNQATLIRQRLEKMEEKLRKQRKENHGKEMTHMMFQSIMDPQTTLLMLNTMDYKELTRVTDQKLMEVVERMNEMRRRDSSSFNPPQDGAGGSGGGGNQQLVLRHDEFMPPNHHGMFQSSSLGSSLMPNMTYPPPTMSFSPQNMNFHPTNMGFEPLNIDLQPVNMGIQPPNMDFPPADMGFQPLSTDFPQNDMEYVHPNMGMPYPNNQPMFPYYHNADMDPYDPSLH